MGENVDSGGYRAFISYSHRDQAAARRLHRALETYRLPRRLTGGGVSRRLTPIFRDRDELPAAGDLSEKIKDALERSEALIILCTPAARASIWVAREIETFRALHPDRPVLAALIAGEPADAFPPLLSEACGAEPLAADFRKQGDGERLARLKLIAGLTGVGLDALVQRDAQRQIRRVTAITLGAVTAMLIMALLLLLAVNARREAERQRTEAEGLVEFMLTDLRTRLKGVGRLDVMGAVNERAIAYYGKQPIGTLSDDSLERRARVLHAMGEDAQQSRDFDRALDLFRSAGVSTRAVLARHPNDPKAIYTHAQSEFWLGNTFQLRGDRPQAERQYRRYADAAIRLLALEPDNPDYMMEGAYASVNLGIVRYGAEDFAGAEQLFRDGINRFGTVSGLRPEDSSIHVEVANAYGWLADSLLGQKKLAGAVAARRNQLGIAHKLSRADPSNIQRTYGSTIAEQALGQMLVASGDPKAGSALLWRAYRQGGRLIEHDADNSKWILLKAKIACQLLAIPNEKQRDYLADEIRSMASHLKSEKYPRVNEIKPCVDTTQ